MKKWNIGWGTVSHCNMKCEFCYSSQRRNISDDLSFDHWKKFVDDNYSEIGTINYGTGENALSQDWFRLVDYIRKKYPLIRQALTTNGYICEAIAKSAQNAEIFFSSIDEVDVSLDFADEKRHCDFRGQPFAYKWALKTMKLCSENNIPLTIVVLGSKVNLYEENLCGIFEIAKKYNAIVRVNMYRPTKGIDKLSSRYILSTDELLLFLKFVSEKYQVLSVNDPVISSLLTNSTVNDPSGRDSLRILPNGDVTPSTYLISEDFVISNIKDGVNLQELEKNAVLKQKIKRVIPKSCCGCVYRDTCAGGVIDRRYLWYGTLEEKDPYCFIEKIDAEKYNFKIALSDDEFHSVHDGYLPTMFFKNK